jgi:DNA invertase Pin-like site-specific DNA recombinase
MGKYTKKTRTIIKSKKSNNNVYDLLKTPTFTLNKTKRPAIIYCRVSTKGQSNINQGHVSLDAQESACINYAKQHGYEVTDVIKEVQSARKMNKMYNLMKAINNKDNVAIIFHNISRFSRNTTDALKLYPMINQKNIKLISVTDNIDTDTASGKHVFRTLLSNAQYESDLISERVRTSLAYKRTIGSYIGNPEYGSMITKRGNIRRKVQNPYEQNVILFIIALRKGLLNTTGLCSLMDLIKKVKEPSKIEFHVENTTTGETIKNLTYLDKDAMPFEDIAELLNDYGVTRRNKEWNGSKVRIIYNNALKNIDNYVSNIKKQYHNNFNPNYNIYLNDMSDNDESDEDMSDSENVNEHKISRRFNKLKF